MAGAKKLHCTFTLFYNELRMDEKNSIANCKGKVKRTTTIDGFSIRARELDFTFTLTIPKKGRITFSASSITSILITPSSATTSTTTSSSSTVYGTIIALNMINDFRTKLSSGSLKSMYLSS